MTSIERYRQLQEQIIWIQNEIKRKEYLGAGITVCLGIGNQTDTDQEGIDYKRFTLGVYSEEEEEILKGVQPERGSLREYLRCLCIKGIIPEGNYIVNVSW